MVAVLSKNKKQLMPYTEKRARLLLQKGRARIHRLKPFTIRVVDRRLEDSKLQPVTERLDPGSKATGIAVVRESDSGSHVLFFIELQHRGQQIRDGLKQRRGFRCRRRGTLRYRAKRFDNRRRSKGWLPPSLQHRVDTTMSWVERLKEMAPVTAVSMELVKFDTQLLENPDISGVEYQQGELAGFEVREYLLEKWGRQCAYCGCEGVPLQIDHIIARAKSGTNRVPNLTLACQKCNQKEGNLDVRVFLKDNPEALQKIPAGAKAPLKDAAAVNATRWALYGRLKKMGLPVDTGSSGQIKWNRTRFGIPKGHALDALCVGKVDAVHGRRIPTLQIKCTGRGSYKRTRLDQFGFPRGYLIRQKSVFGFQTGDTTKASVPKGKKGGEYVGRVAVRATGSFNIQTVTGTIQGTSHKYCQLTQRADGYGYNFKRHTLPPGFEKPSIPAQGGS
ncbi:MAG TPA: HNH endonuclease [Nitrospiraceae bacterium]|jgi:5-methylcytosine-specific restriction endonuclease McrA|nr:HNH endonuclease [Nitrospiraceae bacterium]